MQKTKMTRTYPLCYPSSYHNAPLDIPRSPLLLRTQGVERSTGEKNNYLEVFCKDLWTGGEISLELMP